MPHLWPDLANVYTSARALVAKGAISPTVEEAAAAASLSRTTAYRYFPHQRALLVAAHPEIDSLSLLPEDPGTDPEDRLLSVVKVFRQQIIEAEQQHRTMLRLFLEAGTDIAGLSRDQAGEVMHWSARAMLHEALAAGPYDSRRTGQ